MADINMTRAQVAARIRSVGDVNSLTTTERTNLVGAVNELKRNINNIVGFRIISHFDTYAELVAGVTNPAAGEAYSVGTVVPYDVYVYDAVNGWLNYGDMGVSADAETIQFDESEPYTSGSIGYAVQELSRGLGDKQSKINASGILKGDGAGGVSAASAGADFAPGGYGLGSKWNTAPSNDANLITGSGFQMASTNAPLSAWWGILSFVYDNSSATQWAIPQNTSSSYFGSVCKREKRNGTWSPWEWVNPPMAVGVEYRTTERYLGKPVYVKAVNCGAISANTRKQVGLGSANVSACIGCFVEAEYAVAGTRVLMPFGDPTNSAYGEVMVVTSSGGSTINIHAKGTVLASTAVVKYTKTTD